MDVILDGPTARISRFHRDGPGSTPGQGTFFSSTKLACPFILLLEDFGQTKKCKKLNDWLVEYL